MKYEAIKQISNQDIFFRTFKHNGVVCSVADLKIIIRDNLSAINYFQVTASGIKIS